jgi:integrase
MKFKRTRYQFGCIERKKRKKGPDVWVLRYRETSADGGTIQRGVRIGDVVQFPAESQAWRAAEALRLSINPENPNGSLVSFGALIDRYEQEELPERHSTRRFYLPWLRQYIKPRWGSYPISQVKPFAVEQWLKGLNLAPKSKRNIRSLMHILFNCAMRWELIEVQANPMSLVRVKGSSKRRREPRVLTVQELNKLIKYVNEPYRTMCIVAMCLGLRVSEVAGLQWGDFDWGQKTVMVQRSYVAGVAGDVKTAYSRKWMPLDPNLAEILRQYKCRFASNVKEADWLFPNPRTGKPWWPGRILQTQILPAAKKAGLGSVGWHTFRHTYSTMLRSLKVDLKVQQELLRHADIRTTMNVYTQAVPQDLREANSKVVEMVLPAAVGV